MMEETLASSIALIKAVAVRVKALEDAHDELNRKVDANTKITASIKSDTGDIVDFFNAGKGTFKVLGWLGKGIKWVSSVALAIGAVYAAWKYGP